MFIDVCECMYKKRKMNEYALDGFKQIWVGL